MQIDSSAVEEQVTQAADSPRRLYAICAAFALLGCWLWLPHGLLAIGVSPLWQSPIASRGHPQLTCRAWSLGQAMTWTTPAAPVPALSASLQPGYVMWSEADLRKGLPFAQPDPYVWFSHLDDRQAGIVMPGNPSRLRAAWHRTLHEKKPLKIGFIGGSITEGSCCVFESMTWPRWTELVVKKHLPPATAARITFSNHAVGGAISNHFEVCQHGLAADTDVIFVEFASNDRFQGGFEKSGMRRSYERLLRQLLQYPQRPAVVLMNMAVNLDVNQPTPPPLWPWESAEREFWEFAAGYRVPALSFKSAAMHLVAEGAPGYWMNDTRKASNARAVAEGREHWTVVGDQEHQRWRDDNAQEVLFSDGGHPNPATGMRLMGEIAAQYLLDVAASTFAVPLTDVERHKIQAPLPAPLIRGNYEYHQAGCIMGRDLQTIATPSPEWQLSDEGRKKWGYISNVTGANLRLTLNTSLPGLDGSALVKVDLGFLNSYENMGIAQINCVTTCICNSTQMDGTWSEHASQLMEHTVILSQADACLIDITVLKETHSPNGSRKVKLLAVAWGAAAPSGDGYATHLRTVEQMSRAHNKGATWV